MKDKRNLLFLLLFVFSSKSLGVIPPYRDAHKFVIQQRCEHFNDLRHALKVMRKISDDDDMPYQMSMMYLLDEGALRFVKIPKVKESLYHL